MAIFGITWQANRTAFPKEGDAYYDVNLESAMIYDGSHWIQYSGPNLHDKPLIPSKENLEKYPSLKEAWEHYLVVKKLLGV
jgi:hypothetical protein